MNIVGLDIGGANLKAHDTNGQTRCSPFPVWQFPERLGSELESLLGKFVPFDLIAVTMTAELADCYQTKAHGVAEILGHLQAATDRPIVVWQTGAEFVSPEVAVQVPSLVAAANWHALATWIGRLVPAGPALLIDMGSTTTDIIPLIDGVPVPVGMTDVERLMAGELVYSGIRRTPLCAIVHSVPIGEAYCPLAAELFATTLDIHVLLGTLPESTEDRDTANQQPATRSAAHDRIARMLCCDCSELPLESAIQIARFIADVQKKRIAGAIDRVLQVQEKPETILISGSGRVLIDQVLDEHPRIGSIPRVDLATTFSADWAEAACACAVARLAEERVTLQGVE